MKKLLSIMLLPVVITSCRRPQQPLVAAEHENDSLKMVIYQKNHLISEYKGVLVEIESNLDSINRRQHVIVLKAGSKDLKGNVVSEINAQISSINSILERNRVTIDRLNKQLKLLREDNAELRSEVERMNSQLSARENALDSLRGKLDAYGKKVTALQTVAGYLVLTNAVLDETLAEETDMHHTAFYICGTASELREKKIIGKEGGLLGIGKVNTVNAAFDKNEFTAIDYSVTNSIPVNGKKVKLLTSHPPYSYKTEMDGETVKRIIIADPEKFWGVSKYLVIVKD